MSQRQQGYWVRTAVLSVAVVALGFLSGYAVGTLRMTRWMMRSLGAETQGNLVLRVDTLARLRTGDPEGAIAQLERSVDTALVTLPQQETWSELPPSTQNAMMLAKAYRTAFPPTDPSSDLASTLLEVPLPPRQLCSPALQEVLELANVVDSTSRQ